MALDTLPVAPSTRPQIRVVVVDDNPGFRETLASLLGTEELLVVGAAGNGSDAMSLVRSTQPDVVLMDVRMPQMNGIEATRLLKSAFPEIGIVALTGVDDQDAVREAPATSISAATRSVSPWRTWTRAAGPSIRSRASSRRWARSSRPAT